MGEESLGGAESLNQGQLKSNLFQGGILAEAISMTYSGILHQLDISTFCFCEPLPFQIFVTLEFIKSHAFPCLLLLSYIRYEIKFYTKIHIKVFYI